ncbi:MAG TPA: tyrosine-protein phosphatase [Micromonosporaceae bacterium]
MPARTIAFSSLFNFRDLGGYPTADGRTVRWRRLFRSDSPHRLNGDDLTEFAKLGVRTVIDLRRPSEVDRDGRIPELPGLTYRHLHPRHREWQEYPFDPVAGQARFLADRYLELAEDGIDTYGEALRVVADSRNAPVIVHCFAGKDRTGVLCAVTLGLLGVDDDTIADEYALTERTEATFTEFLRTRYPHWPPLPAHFLGAPRAAMLLFLAGLRERYGSPHGYAEAAGLSGTEVAALREHLLDG